MPDVIVSNSACVLDRQYKEREADHSISPSANVSNAYNYIPIVPHYRHAKYISVIFPRRQTDILNLFESLYRDNELINTLETVSFIQRNTQNFH